MINFLKFKFIKEIYFKNQLMILPNNIIWIMIFKKNLSFKFSNSQNKYCDTYNFYKIFKIIFNYFEQKISHLFLLHISGFIISYFFYFRNSNIFYMKNCLLISFLSTKKKSTNLSTFCLSFFYHYLHNLLYSLLIRY